MTQEATSGVFQARMSPIQQFDFRTAKKHEKQVGLLLFEDCSFLDIALVIEIFDLANSVAQVSRGRTTHRYAVSLLSGGGGRIRCANSITVETQSLDVSEPSSYDVLFIADGEGAPAAANDSQTINWLKRAFQTVKVVQASGNGALLLKGAQLPSARGMIVPIRPAGARLDSVSESSIQLDVNAGSLMLTALSLVKADFDYETAEGIADQLMPFSGRWLAPLLGDLPNANIASTMKEATRWIDENCAHPITVHDMARSVSMGERTFLRHFKAEIGMPPSEYLLRVRLDLACRLLITTTLPIDKIARRCGMGNGIRLAKIFKRRLSMS